MSEARLTHVAGPVIRAESNGAFHLHEALAVGPQRLPGEVVELNGRQIVAQVYEDTTGLEPGAIVTGSGLPLSIHLGPGLLGNIFDGLLRPLPEGITTLEPGRSAAAAQRRRFEPRIAVDDQLRGGQAFGVATDEPCIAPPGVLGRVVRVVPAGEYLDSEVLVELELADGGTRSLMFGHDWPVRTPRPVAARLAPSGPLITGQRILDTLFPVARGGRAALPGGFGTGKTILQEALAKWCDADVIIYVGCGERGNEMAEVLDELPALEDPRTGRRLMERAVIIANTSNMAVAAREASIYTAVTVGEYFRDLGRHVALLADSTSRWAEALREVSGRLGELPGEAGYPAYLSSRLAEFYARAARVRTLGGLEGSLTIIGAVSPPAGDFSEPVTLHTRRYVRSFWALDPERAHARFYPAIHPLTSYSEDARGLAAWWQANGNSAWAQHRERLLALLERAARLERMARIVGRDALPPEQQVTLLLADLVNEGLLRQSSFSDVDRYCSPARQSALVRLIIGFIEHAEGAVGRGLAPARIAALPGLADLRRAGEDHGEDDLAGIDELGQRLDAALAAAEADDAR
ncbi:MAG TPA: V-type ATP synthase subunit A [Steroidobacteraceae bacterium]|nr:V-type ATP synthase subunit A [Steroidobacteraceae bacterium]